MMTSRRSCLGCMALCALLAAVPACRDEVEGGTGHGAAGGVGGPGAGGGSTSSGEGGGGGSAGPSDAGVDAPSVDKAGACASTFGQKLTNAFGRLDGTVLAVVKPSDTQCPLPNSDHVILEVTMGGEVYRMVVNVQSTFGDPKVRFLASYHALPAPAWSEGWHAGLSLDYPKDLGVHTAAFTPYGLTELSNTIADAVTLGQKVSVYATSSGGSSAHLVHRQGGGTDGAIVLDPDGRSPRMLLFAFSDQTF